MSMITYRMQDKSRSLEALLDPEQQYSFSMGNQDEDVRHGVSGMASIHELAAYLAVMAIEATSPVLVRIEGPLSGDTPCDEAMGEYLTLPTSAEIVADDADFFELVSELVDLHWGQGVEFEQLRDIAGERLAYI